MEPVPSSLEVQNLDHWTTREVPMGSNFKLNSRHCECYIICAGLLILLHLFGGFVEVILRLASRLP